MARVARKFPTLVVAFGFAFGLSGCDCGAYEKHADDDPKGDRGPCPGGDCDCEEDPEAPGCPCDVLEPVTCFEGPAGAAGVGECVAGLRTCTDGVWGHCIGARLPTEEVCDELDNDCDGETDDGVLSACGDCSPDCREITFGDEEGEIPFGPDEGNASGVVERDDGALVLEGDTFRLHVIWIVNTPDSTISKIDTDTREEEARYRTGPDGTLHSPSRTSLDYRGNAYVANRAFGNQPSVTKIYERDCPDVDGDFRADTSTGREDVYPWGDDECLAWHTEVGNWRGIARAIAVHTRIGEGGVPEDFVWVGLYSERRYVELEAESGEPTGREANLAPCSPYGAAIDRDGNLWSACSSSYLGRFDTDDPDDAEVLTQPASNYGITVDEDGIVWTGGTCQRYDPFLEEHTRIADCGGAGIAVDGNGWIWVGGCWGGAGGGTCRIDAETLEVTSVDARSRGVAVDFEGSIWGIPLGPGFVDLIEPGDEPGEERVERILDDCDGVEGACLSVPYTYSDMSGFQLHNATNPEGWWETSLEGCEGDETNWVRLSWDAETMEGTSVTFQVRAADSLDELSMRPWVTAAVAPRDEAPVDLSEVLGVDTHAAYLGVRTRLATARHGATPVLHSVSVQRSCPFSLR